MAAAKKVPMEPAGNGASAVLPGSPWGRLAAGAAVVAIALVAWWVLGQRPSPESAVEPGPGATDESARGGTTVAGSAPSTEAAIDEKATGRAEELRIEVLSVRPHDPEAFTQGLVWLDGRLYESTGLYGRSTLREVDPADGGVLRRLALPEDRFGEGLALVGERLIQLTWQSGEAYVYDRTSLERTGQFGYETEGWGLCYDGQRLVMSDGSPSLFFRSPETFELEDRVTVTLDGVPLQRLNELECVAGDVFANVWQTDLIVRIDPGTGRVLAFADASDLLPPAERQGADVLNGIAYDASSGTFLVTGKLWPNLYEVQFVPDAED